jgi:hypothetical protein
MHLGHQHDALAVVTNVKARLLVYVFGDRCDFGFHGGNGNGSACIASTEKRFWNERASSVVLQGNRSVGSRASQTTT